MSPIAKTAPEFRVRFGGDTGPLDNAATLADGLTVQRLLDAARRSADERRWIEL